MKYIVYLGIFGFVLFFIFGPSDDKAKIELSEGDLKVTKLDLERVLDLTVPIVVANANESSNLNPSNDEEKEYLFGRYIWKTADELAITYNTDSPKIYEDNLDVYPATDGSLIAYEDLNKNRKKDDNEENIFFIDVDGENSRIIATSRIGASSNASFPAGTLMAGYFLGRMLTMQSAFPSHKSYVNNAKTVTPKNAISTARSRAGSGSHRAGK